jgi:hypothetical protein
MPSDGTSANLAPATRIDWRCTRILASHGGSGCCSRVDSGSAGQRLRQLPSHFGHIRPSQRQNQSRPLGPSCSDVRLEAPADSAIFGTARLCVSDVDVRAEFGASRLEANNVYAVWFLYLDRQPACKVFACIGLEARGGDAVGTVARLDSAVADDYRSLAFSGTLRDLRLSSGSEVWLVLVNEGVASTDNYARAQQLLAPPSFAPGSSTHARNADDRDASSVARAVFDFP